jgi:ribosomal protein S18 acetylase RimI-like enzyme
MLSDPIKTLIREEYARQGGEFIAGVDVDHYLAKLDTHAEIAADWLGERCRGFVAFSCNDLTTRKAYITLVLVDPRDRGRGLGKALVGRALAVARDRGFSSCGLEVRRGNTASASLYRTMAFRVVERDEGRERLETDL